MQEIQIIISEQIHTFKIYEEDSTVDWNFKFNVHNVYFNTFNTHI